MKTPEEDIVSFEAEDEELDEMIDKIIALIEENARLRSQIVQRQLQQFIDHYISDND